MMEFLKILMVFSAVIGAAMILRRPYWAFVLVILMFAMEQLLQSSFTLFEVRYSLFNYLVAGTAALAIALRVLRREPVGSGMNNAVTYLVFAQFFLWMVAILYSPLPDFAFQTFRGAWPYIALFVCLLPLLVVDIAEVRKVMIGLMLVGCIIALLIVFNPRSSYYQGRLVIDIGMAALRKDEVGNPLAIAEMGGMIALIAALIAPVRRGGWFMILRAAAFVLGLGLAIGSGSRGQVLATVVAGILFYPLAKRVNSPRNFIFTTVGLLVLVSGVYMVFLLFIGEQNRLRWDIGYMVRDIALRFDMCWMLLEAWIASPAHWLFGLGTNAFVDVSGASLDQGGYVHNVAVEILCEHGVVGAVIFVAAVVLTIRSGMRLWQMFRDDAAMRSVAAILLAISAFALFNALKQGSIISAAPFFWWLVLAKVARHEEMSLALEPAAPESHRGDAVDLEYDQGYVLAR